MWPSKRGKRFIQWQGAKIKNKIQDSLIATTGILIEKFKNLSHCLCIISWNARYKCRIRGKLLFHCYLNLVSNLSSIYSVLNSRVVPFFAGTLSNVWFHTGKKNYANILLHGINRSQSEMLGAGVNINIQSQSAPSMREPWVFDRPWWLFILSSLAIEIVVLTHEL